MVKIKTVVDIFSYAIVLLGIAPLFLDLDLPVQILLPPALMLAIFYDRRGRPLLSPLAATVITLLFFLYYGAQMNGGNFIPPVINTLALLLAVRLLTVKAARNYLQIFVLSLFALASSSLLSLTPLFLLFLVLMILLVTIGLVLVTFFTVDAGITFNRLQARLVTAVAVVLPLGSLLLMVVFFPVLPRTQQPLWDFLNPNVEAAAGFSEKVQPGSVARMTALKKVAFRAESMPLPMEDLYWRGIVLNRLDGTTWTRKEDVTETSRLTGGEPVQQIISVEPHAGGYLFALDIPASVEGYRIRSTGDRVFTAYRARQQRTRYEALSRRGAKLVDLRGFDRQSYLNIPLGLSDRVREEAEKIRRGGKSTEERIALAEQFFRGQNLSYATEDLSDSQHPVDDFLFGKRRGYCEFFASSFAILLRLADVPTRLVGGYLGGDYNDLGGYYLVTEDMAHVWVEAHLENGSWVRLDPSRLAINAATAIRANTPQKLGMMRQIADSASYFWSQSILNYDLVRQIEILQSAGQSLRRMEWSRPSATSLYISFAGVFIAALTFLLLRHFRKTRERRLLESYFRLLEKQYRLGTVPRNQGLVELARRTGDPLCREFADLYGGAIYRDRRLSDTELLRLKELIRQMRRGK